MIRTERMYGGGGERYGENLENLRLLFESMSQELSMYKAQRDEFERKLAAQLNEFSTFQQMLYELEKNYQRSKTTYEEEIARLRKQLESSSHDPKSAMPMLAPPALSNGNLPRKTPSPTPPTALVPLPSVPAPPPTAKFEEKERDRERDDKGSPLDWTVGYNPAVQKLITIDQLHHLKHASVVCCVKFSPDGKYVATGCNRSAQLYDVESGRKVHTFVESTARDEDLYVRSLSFSPDGQYLATGAEDKTVKMWDIAQNRVLHTFVGHELDIYSIDYSRDGRFIVSGSGDKKAKIWDIQKGRCSFTLGNEEVGPKDGVTSVAFSPDGRLVAAGSLDRIIRLWDAHTGYFLERYEGHVDAVYSISFSPDGKSLASASLDKTIKLWDLSGSRTRSRCRSTLFGHKDFVLSLTYSLDGNWIISGSKDRSVQLWDSKSGVAHTMVMGHKNSVISVAASPTNGVFASGGGDQSVCLWKYSG